MKNQKCLVLLAFMWLVIAIGQCNGLESTLVDVWNGGFKGRVDIPLSKPISYGWTVTLSFDKRVTNLQVPNAAIISQSNYHVYVVENQSYNHQVNGDFLSIVFIGNTNSDTGSIARVELEVTIPTPARGADYYECGCDYEVTCLDSWDGHLKARVTVPVSTPLTSGWTLFLQFSDPASSIQVFDGENRGTQDNGFTYKVKNKPHNAYVANQIVQEFIIQFEGYVPPKIYPRLNNRALCECKEDQCQPAIEETVTTQSTDESTSDLIAVDPLTSTSAVLATCQVSSCTCGSSVEVVGRWDGNVHGEISIPITSETTSWNLKLFFSVPVAYITIWNAREVSKYADNTAYLLRNKEYNGYLTPGQTITLNFIATYSGAVEPLWGGVLSGQPVCGNPLPSTTQRPTTPVVPLQTEGLGCLESVCTCGSSITVIQSWPGNVQGQISIPITTATSSWNLQLTFSVPVNNIQIWDAVELSKSADQKTYFFREESYNGYLYPEQILTIEFIATYSGPEAPIFDSKLSNQPICGPGELLPQSTTTQSGPTTKYTSTTTQASATTKQPRATTKVQPKPTTAQPATTTNDKTKPTTAQPPAPTKGHPTTLTEQSTAKSRPTTNFASTTNQPPATTKGQPKSTTTQPAETTMKEQTEPTTAQTATTTKGHPTTTMKATTTRRGQSATTPQATTSTGSRPVNVPGMPYPYFEVLEKSILFYEAQRSGKLPATQRVTWRHNSFENDGSDNGVDLNGGWFDAGDYVKFGLPMAQSATLLAWGAIEFKDAYIAARQWQWMLDCLKWATDYFLKCHTGPNEFYAQVGDGNVDHAFWGRPEDFSASRPSFKLDENKPGSDVVGETAAALAAASIVFRDYDPSYADSLLNSATELYSFANTYRGIYQNSIPNAGSFYPSSGYGDELAWAAAWVYRANLAKGETTNHLDDARNHYDAFGLGDVPWAFSWDEKKPGVQLLMYMLTGESKFETAIQNAISPWLPGGTIPYTTLGLAYRDQWGVNRYSANMAFLSLVAADYIPSKTADYREFAESQINYMLGDAGRSYVVGFGKNPPTEPHHRSSSCPISGQCDWTNYGAPGSNPQILYGALVGGPDKNDQFTDDRTDFIYNEITTDYNAGFQSAVAGIYRLYLP